MTERLFSPFKSLFKSVFKKNTNNEKLTKNTNNKKLTKEKIIYENLLPLIKPIYDKMFENKINEDFNINNEKINETIINFLNKNKIITEADVRSYFKENNNKELIEVKEKIIYKNLLPLIVPIFYNILKNQKSKNILKNQKSKNNEIPNSNNELINKTITNFLTEYKIIHEDDISSYLEKKHSLIQLKVYEIEKKILIKNKENEKKKINNKIKEINNKLVLTNPIKNNLNKLLGSDIFLYRILREILKNYNIDPDLYKEKNKVAYKFFFNLFKTKKNNYTLSVNISNRYETTNIDLFKNIRNELSKSITNEDYKKNIIEYMNNLEEKYKIQQQYILLKGSSPGQKGNIIFGSDMEKFKRKFPDEKIITFEY